MQIKTAAYPPTDRPRESRECVARDEGSVRLLPHERVALRVAPAVRTHLPAIQLTSWADQCTDPGGSLSGWT